MVDPNDINFKITVVKFDLVDHAYATYLIKVIGPKNIAFHIRDRYSLIRTWQDQVKKAIPNSESTPECPSKKMFGNMEAPFLALRSQ